jgi:hypothetical protein
MKSDSPSASRAAQRPAISRAVGNKIDVNRLIGVLNEIVATEIVCYLRRDPDFNSATLKECSHTEYVTVDDADLTRILKELGRRTDRHHHR